MAKLAGWYTDPSRRHQLRYRDDSQWTKWAADADDLVEDPDGVSASTTAITRRHRRGWVIAAVAATIGGLILVGCITLINHAELRGTSEVVAEMNGWKLPPSVARSSRADHIERGNLTDASPSVTRWFDPVGTTPTEAILDLVASLQAQGYKVEKHADWWFADCRYNSRYCKIAIGLDASGQRIEVEVTP